MLFMECFDQNMVYKTTASSKKHLNDVIFIGNTSILFDILFNSLWGNKVIEWKSLF